MIIIIEIFINMLPKKFYKNNNKKIKELLSKVKLYTITYDYILNPYYGEYIKESFDKWGNIVDVLGFMKLSGLENDEVDNPEKEHLFKMKKQRPTVYSSAVLINSFASLNICFWSSIEL